MFFLKDLPSDNELKLLSERYSDIDPDATKACLLLMRTGSDIAQAFETILEKDNLSMGRFLSLMVLNRSPEESLSASELAEKVGVKRPTMTGLLDGLEKDKLVKRLTIDNDRRRIQVNITEKGKKRLDAVLPGYYQLISSLMSNLTKKNQRTLTALLTMAFPGIY